MKLPPLAHHRRVIPIVAEQGGKGDTIILDQAFLLGPEHPSLEYGAPRIATCQQTISGRGADRIGTVPVGEGHAFASKSIEIRCLELGLWVEAGSVTVALVVGVDHDDVGTLGGARHGGQKEGDE